MAEEATIEFFARLCYMSELLGRENMDDVTPYEKLSRREKQRLREIARVEVESVSNVSDKSDQE